MNLKKYRERANLKQVELGALVVKKLSGQITAAYCQKLISNWEHQGKLPAKEIQAAIFEVLNIAPDECLTPAEPICPNGEGAWYVYLLESVRLNVEKYARLSLSDTEARGDISDHIDELLLILRRSFLASGAKLDAKQRVEQILEEFSSKLPKADYVSSFLRQSIKTLSGIRDNPNTSFP